MAKKKVALERCMFCDEYPCKCDGVVLRSKAMRLAHSNPTNEDNDGVPERREGSLSDGVQQAAERTAEPADDPEPKEEEELPW